MRDNRHFYTNTARLCSPVVSGPAVRTTRMCAHTCIFRYSFSSETHSSSIVVLYVFSAQIPDPSQNFQSPCFKHQEQRQRVQNDVLSPKHHFLPSEWACRCSRSPSQTVCLPTIETIFTFWSYSDPNKVKRCFWELPINNVESLGPSSTLASPELARECPCRWASSPQMNCCREMRLIMLLGCRLLQQSPQEPAGQFGWTRSLVVLSDSCTLIPCLHFCFLLNSRLKSLLRRGPVPFSFRHR